MPNRKAKARKQERRKKNKILERTGRTPAQIKRFYIYRFRDKHLI